MYQYALSSYHPTLGPTCWKSKLVMQNINRYSIQKAGPTYNNSWLCLLIVVGRSEGYDLTIAAQRWRSDRDGSMVDYYW